MKIFCVVVGLDSSIMRGFHHIQCDHVVRVQHSELILELFVIHLLQVLNAARAPFINFD